MENIRIITNNQWRPLLYLSDLSEGEQSQVASDYDWMDSLELDGWIKYRGMIFHLSDFLRLDSSDTFGGNWHGYFSAGFFDGYLIELSDCGESYRIAHYIG
jgi:hypothetical protein